MSRRRAELVSIAADLFAEHGFAGVTVDDIGDAAGVSGPALYHHFAGKEALLGEMLVGISQYLLDGGRVIAAEDGDVLARLVRFHAEFAVDDRSLITVHFRDLVHTARADHERVRALQGEYVSLWSAAVGGRRPELDPETVVAAVHAVFGLINSTPFSARLPREAMIDLLSATALGALDAIPATVRT